MLEIQEVLLTQDSRLMFRVTTCNSRFHRAPSPLYGHTMPLPSGRFRGVASELSLPSWRFRVVASDLSLPLLQGLILLQCNVSFQVLLPSCHFRVVTFELSLPGCRFRVVTFKLSLSSCLFRVVARLGKSLPNMAAMLVKFAYRVPPSCAWQPLSKVLIQVLYFWNCNPKHSALKICGRFCHQIYSPRWRYQMSNLIWICSSSVYLNIPCIFGWRTLYLERFLLTSCLTGVFDFLITFIWEVGYPAKASPA